MSHFHHMFPWLHRHMIDLSHIDVTLIDGWGTSQFNRQDNEKWTRREHLFLKDRCTIRRLKFGSCVWRAVDKLKPHAWKNQKQRATHQLCPAGYDTALNSHCQWLWHEFLLLFLYFLLNMEGSVMVWTSRCIETKVWNKDILCQLITVAPIL